MSSMSTRWSVVQEHDVGPADLDADGHVTLNAVGRWAASARAEYLAQCSILEATRDRSGLELQLQNEGRPQTAALAGAARVVVSATATEVFPTSFVIALRIRALGTGSDAPVNIACAVRIVDPATGVPSPIDDAIRDELIALEHAARHFN
jgi:acyl-CoA thioesterase FadM